MYVVYSDSFRQTLYRHYPECPVCTALLDSHDTTTEYANYVTQRGEMLSFLPNGKPHETTYDGRWQRANRQEGKPAKVARKLLTISAQSRLTDKDFETFANRIKATGIRETGTISIVYGEDIRHWYNENRYASGVSIGSLGQSCMRYSSCGDYLGIYTDNPDTVGLAILVNAENGLLGRALVWQTDHGTVMDRIYGSDATIEVFRDYASDLGWIYRQYQDYTSGTQWVQNGEPVTLYLTLSGIETDFDAYPYMDTFKYISRNGSVSNVSDGSYDLYATGTSGTDHEGMDADDDSRRCTHCAEYYPSDDMTDGYCHDCYAETHTECTSCYASVHTDDTFSDPDGDTLCERCYDSLCATCQHCGETVWVDDVTQHGYCEPCQTAHYTPCTVCTEMVRNGTADYAGRCSGCARNAETVAQGLTCTVTVPIGLFDTPNALPYVGSVPAYTLYVDRS